MRGQEERRAAAERHVVRVELEREEQARAAVVEERARIARELHDAVAHSVSVMVLQAGGVRRLLGNDPAREREREALAGVEETGRQAVGELHRMLGILRKTDPGAELAPSPSLRRVERAGRPGPLRRARRVADVDGEPAELAPGLDMSAYRIVQEALTNALRYAPGATVGVTVDLRPRPAARGARRRRARQRPRAHRRAPATASSACASARRCSAASSRPARRPAAASSSVRGYRYDHASSSPTIRRSCAPG